MLRLLPPAVVCASLLAACASPIGPTTSNINPPGPDCFVCPRDNPGNPPTGAPSDRAPETGPGGSAGVIR